MGDTLSTLSRMDPDRSVDDFTKTNPSAPASGISSPASPAPNPQPPLNRAPTTQGPPAVQLCQVGKRFRLGETYGSLRELLAGGIRNLCRRRRGPDGLRSDPRRQLSWATSTGSNRRDEGLAPVQKYFWAVKDLSFTVHKGEAFGIIGPNGAGKSTVLKLLAGILRADLGEVTVHGRLAALIEVGAGFHGDLTGRENIFLNGAILGMTRPEIRRKLDAIVSFAGIEPFLDMPVKRYSSGMYARLGFSIAAHVDPEVLLVDEVLSVGDAVFRLRCMERMRELVNGGTTLVFVTHNLDQMKTICGRALVLDGGRVLFEGSSRECVSHYLRAVSHTQVGRPTDVSAEADQPDQAVELLSLTFSKGPVPLNQACETTVWIKSQEAVHASLRVKLHRHIPRLVVELNMRSSSYQSDVDGTGSLEGARLLSFNSGRDDQVFDLNAGSHVLTLSLPSLPLAGGHYDWNVRMWDAQTGMTLLDTPFQFPMGIEDEGRACGVLAIDRKWSCAAFREHIHVSES